MYSMEVYHTTSHVIVTSEVVFPLSHQVVSMITVIASLLFRYSSSKQQCHMIQKYLTKHRIHGVSRNSYPASKHKQANTSTEQPPNNGGQTATTLNKRM